MGSFSEFQEFLIENDLSNKTIEAYSRDVEQFLKFFKDRDLSSLNHKDIAEYKRYLIEDRKLNLNSINRKLVPISKYLVFCGVPVLIKQEKIHTQNFLDDIFTDYDINAILDAIQEHHDLRAKALIETLKMTGMRISEVLQLKVDDVDKETVTIKGKGNKYREVFISNKLKLYWKHYLQVRIDKSNKLFTGRKGAINRQTVHRIVKKYASLANVDEKKAHCHNFRHKFAKVLIQKNIPIDAVADLLGHVNINTTRTYTRKTKKELLEIIDTI